MKFTCPVCGYKGLDEPAYNEYGDPSYEICSCCGFEYGFDDHSEGYTFQSYREKWINEEYSFHNKNNMPRDWSEAKAKEQLLNLQYQ